MYLNQLLLMEEDTARKILTGEDLRISLMLDEASSDPGRITGWQILLSDPQEVIPMIQKIRYR